MLPFMSPDIKEIPILNNAFLEKIKLAQTQEIPILNNAFLEKIKLDKTQAIYVNHLSLNCTRGYNHLKCSLRDMLIHIEILLQVSQCLMAS
jgi:hypothetical protein